LLLRDLRKGPVPGLERLVAAQADIVLLTDFDFDADLLALEALREALSAEELHYPHLFAALPNTGVSTGLDLDGDGRRGGPRDAQGFGYFAGQGGQAVLSRFPVRLVQDFTNLLWRDAPDSLMADLPGPDVQRLSSSAHWQLDVTTSDGVVSLLTLAATPPVFDGPEDRNGRRNFDEVSLWRHVLDGRFGQPIARPVILGNLNLEPENGDGRRGGVRAWLDHPRLQDPLPDRATTYWAKTGRMRVSYVLPASDITVVGAGVMRSAENAGPHQLVWGDLDLGSEPE
jgi:hypothetical protein